MRKFITPRNFTRNLTVHRKKNINEIMECVSLTDGKFMEHFLEAL